MKKSRKKWAVALAGIGLIYSGCGLIRRLHCKPLKDVKLVPYAIGRYLVDLPHGVRLVDWYQRFQGTGPVRVARDISFEQFERITRLRADERNTEKAEDGTSLMKQFGELGDRNTRVITYWRNGWEKNDSFIKCDAFHLKNGILYSFENSIDYKQPPQTEYFSGFQRAINAIRPRQIDEIPTEPGTCFENSILLDAPYRGRHDVIMVTGVWPERPDVVFSLVIFANGPHPDPTLFERLKRADQLSGLNVIRARARKVGDYAGEEHLRRVRELNGSVGHLFIWEAQGLPDRNDFPQIRLEMTTGEGKDGPQYSSLSDRDALALWDKVLDSLRWRPTEPPTGPGMGVTPGLPTAFRFLEQ